jgi:hypothetical protein
VNAARRPWRGAPREFSPMAVEGSDLWVQLEGSGKGDFAASAAPSAPIDKYAVFATRPGSKP